MAQSDEFEALLNTEARLYAVAPDGRQLAKIILQLQASADAAAALEQDPALPPELKPQVTDFAAALRVALAQLQGRR